MTISHPTKIPARGNRLRRLTRAALFTAALGIGASAFVHPAIASAEWDIEKYDDCMNYAHDVDAQGCCVYSGGVWTKDGRCVAPAAVSVIQGTTPTQPPRHPVVPVKVPPATLG
jgi:hypothetical protein